MFPSGGNSNPAFGSVPGFASSLPVILEHAHKREEEGWVQLHAENVPTSPKVPNSVSTPEQARWSREDVPGMLMVRGASLARMQDAVIGRLTGSFLRGEGRRLRSQALQGVSWLVTRHRWNPGSRALLWGSRGLCPTWRRPRTSLSFGCSTWNS